MGKNDPIETQIENMRKWAKGASADIKELQSRLLPSVEQMDAISLELADLHAQQAIIASTLGESEKRRAEISALMAHNDEMEVIEAEVALDVSCAVNDAGKLRYSNQAARDQATKIRLNGHERYQDLLAEKRDKEMELASIKAVSDELERQLSLGRGRARALVARLENLTARLK